MQQVPALSKPPVASKLMVIPCLFLAFFNACDSTDAKGDPHKGSDIKSITIRFEPECGFPEQLKDSLTSDSLFFTDGYFGNQSVQAKAVSDSQYLAITELFDSLEIDSLNGLNAAVPPPCMHTLDCKTHNNLRIRRDTVKLYSNTERCVAYDTAYLKAFNAFESAIFKLEK